MTVILGARGFDMGQSMLNTADTIFGTANASTAVAHTGSYSLRLQSTNLNRSGIARWAVSGSDPAFSAWVNLVNTYGSNGTTTNNHIIRWRLTTGEFIDLRWNAGTHTYDAYVNAVLVAAGTVEVSNNTWFHVQAHAVIDNAGSITVLVDGHPSIIYSGDTQPSGAATADFLYIQAGSSNDPDYLDDLVFGSGGLLGDLRVYEKRPASDVIAQWSRVSGASNFSMENETPSSLATYNTAATDGLIDEFGLTALDATGFTIRAVQAWTRAQMSDGVGDSIDVGINSAGDTSVKRSALSSSWEYYHGEAEETDPATAAAWIQAGLDAVLHRKVAVIT